MGLFSENFEKKERKFIKELTDKGVFFEDVARVREKYGREFKNEDFFEEFKNKARKLL